MNNTQLDIWPPFRLIGMSWTALLVIYFLPNSTWALIIKFILGLFILIVVRGSFQPIWNEYATMGAFVTMQTIWFIGLLWTPTSFWYFHILFTFLIVLGIKTKIYQIKNINKGLSPKLNNATSIEK